MPFGAKWNIKFEEKAIKQTEICKKTSPKNKQISVKSSNLQVFKKTRTFKKKTSPNSRENRKVGNTAPTVQYIFWPAQQIFLQLCAMKQYVENKPVFQRCAESEIFLTPTPLLLRLNILWLHPDTLLSFGLRLLLELQSERYKLWQWLLICLWILKFENLFICHLWCNSRLTHDESAVGLVETK